jgi:hypothetical protein
LLDDQEEIVQKTEYSYDTCGRLIQQMEYFPSGGMLTRTYTKCFTYDAPGHLLTASDYRGDAAPSDPQISYEYDSRDRISKVSYEVPGSDIDYVRCIYDSHGWLSQIRVKEGLLEKTLREYTYDSGPGSAEQTETDTSTSTLTFRSNPAVNADPEHTYNGPMISGLPIGSVRQEQTWEWGEDEPPASGQMYRGKREILRYRCVGLIAHFVRAKQVPRLVHDPVKRKLIYAGLANKRLLNGM